MKKRWTAYKLDVKNVAQGNYTSDGFVKYGTLQINRVRLMGTVVQKFIADDDKYGFFILDDGTDTIRIRSFEDAIRLVKDVNIGDIVDVFGRIREYEEEIYVIPEIVKTVADPNFYILRKLELQKQEKKMGVAQSEGKEEETASDSSTLSEEGEELFIEEEIMEEVMKKTSNAKQSTLADPPINPRKKVVDCIAGLDKGEGVEIEQIIEQCGLPIDMIEKILTDLMNEGEIFEPRAGKVKILG